MRDSGASGEQILNGYDPAAWTTFFTAITGAAAALAGLLFVAVSINLDNILKGQAMLPARAAETLARAHRPPRHRRCRLQRLGPPGRDRPIAPSERPSTRSSTSSLSTAGELTTQDTWERLPGDGRLRQGCVGRHLGS